MAMDQERRGERQRVKAVEVGCLYFAEKDPQGYRPPVSGVDPSILQCKSLVVFLSQFVRDRNNFIAPFSTVEIDLNASRLCNRFFLFFSFDTEKGVYASKVGTTHFIKKVLFCGTQVSLGKIFLNASPEDQSATKGSQSVSRDIVGTSLENPQSTADFARNFRTA